MPGGTVPAEREGKMRKFPIPAKRPVQIGFEMTAHGTEVFTGTPVAWYDTDGTVVAVWNTHFGLELTPETAPFMDDLLLAFATHWTHVQVPDVADGPDAWEELARVFLDYLQVYVGDPLGKTILQLVLHPEHMVGWIADFLPAHDAEIQEVDARIDATYDEAKEGAWN